MVHDKQEFLFKEAVDNYLSDWFYENTHLFDWNTMTTISGVAESLVTEFKCRNFDEHWEQGWEWADDGDCWGFDAVNLLNLGR